MFLCVMLNVPNLTYVYLSYFLPTNITWITVVFSIEKLGYGIGSVSLMLYMMQQIAPGQYQTAHYAISTGFMALTMMVTGNDQRGHAGGRRLSDLFHHRLPRDHPIVRCDLVCALPCRTPARHKSRMLKSQPSVLSSHSGSKLR
jgi:hypothetical protein